jgi:hypothetical protein
VLVGGDPADVIVRISGSNVSIAVYSVRWEGPHMPVINPKQLTTLNWKRLPATTVMTTLHGLVIAAIEIRRGDKPARINREQTRLHQTQKKT